MQKRSKMKIFSDNCKKGMRIYKGKFSLLLNLLWWGLVPVCAILIVGGVISETFETIAAGTTLTIIGGFAYAILATKNEEDRWPWQRK